MGKESVVTAHRKIEKDATNQQIRQTWPKLVDRVNLLSAWGQNHAGHIIRIEGWVGAFATDHHRRIAELEARLHELEGSHARARVRRVWSRVFGRGKDGQE